MARILRAVPDVTLAGFTRKDPELLREIGDKTLAEAARRVFRARRGTVTVGSVTAPISDSEPRKQRGLDVEGDRVERVYRALVGGEAYSPGELAKRVALSRTLTFRALARLQKQGRAFVAAAGCRFARWSVTEEGALQAARNAGWTK